jgi:hypothetical protein
VLDSHSAAEDVGCYSAAGMGDVAGTNHGKGADHDSTVQKEASVDYSAKSQYVDGCCYQMLVSVTFSS